MLSWDWRMRIQRVHNFPTKAEVASLISARGLTSQVASWCPLVTTVTKNTTRGPKNARIGNTPDYIFQIEGIKQSYLILTDYKLFQIKMYCNYSVKHSPARMRLMRFPTFISCRASIVSVWNRLMMGESWYDTQIPTPDLAILSIIALDSWISLWKTDK